MLCLELWVNGERLCRASVEESGRLSAHFQWQYHPDDTDERQEEEFGGMTNNPGVRIYGSSGDESHLHYSWPDRRIDPGDHVIFKMTESADFDPPETNDFGSFDVSDTLSAEELGKMEAKWEVDLKVQENPRYCLEVRLNHKLLCTAGLVDFGNLGINFNWHNVPRGKSWISPPRLRVSGHLNREPFQYLKWSDLALEVGDEVAFQLIDAGDFDEPEVVELITPDTKDTWIMKHLVDTFEAKEKYRENLN